MIHFHIVQSKKQSYFVMFFISKGIYIIRNEDVS